MNSFLETPTAEIVNLSNTFNIAVESDHDWTGQGNDEYYVVAFGPGCEGDSDMVRSQCTRLYNGGTSKANAEAYLNWLKLELVAPRTFIPNTFVKPTDAPATEENND